MYTAGSLDASKMHTVAITCEEDYYMDIDFVRARLLDFSFAIASLSLPISFLCCAFVMAVAGNSRSQLTWIGPKPLPGEVEGWTI